MAWVQSDLAAEIREQVLLAVERRINQIDARQGVDLGPAVGTPVNPMAASVEQGVEGSFATGYNSITGQTVAPFQWGISAWNDGEVWTGEGTVNLFTWGTSHWNDGSAWGPAT